MQPGRYVTLREATARYGLSYSQLRLLARTGGFPTRLAIPSTPQGMKAGHSREAGPLAGGEDGRRQFWLKPHGDSKIPADLRERLVEATYRIGFSRPPSEIQVGDVLFVYRVGISAIQYAAECVAPWREATEEEVCQEPWRSRWRWLVEARNLTPEFGGRWARHLLKPFALAREYNALHPNDPQRLGTLNFGNDKLRVSRGFGEFLLAQITSF